MWTTDKVGVKTFKYDDWKLEQHFGSVHFTNCKKYCNCQTWHTYYSSDFAPTIVDASSSIISATTWFPSVTVPDQISESVCLAHSKFFSWRSLSTVKPFASRWLPNLPSSNKTTQFVAEFNNPALGTIECTTAKTICSQEKRIKAIFSKILNWIVYTFSNLVFPSGPPSTVSIIIFFSSCLQIMLNAWHFCAYVCSTWIGDCIIRLIFAFLQSSYHQWWRVSASVYEPQQNLDQATWRRSVVVITTAQLHSTKPELRFCAGSNSARCVSDICDDEDLWQWSRVEIRLTAVRW